MAELNAKGGVLGRKVEVLYGDTRLDPNEAINIARRYVLQEKINAYFGDFTSSGTLAIIDILARANIPQITYTNAIKITRSGYKHVINLKPNSDHLTATALDYAVREKKYGKLAVMALDDEYGKGNVDAIERYLKKFGGAQVVGKEWYRLDAKEFRPLLTKLAALKPDAIVLTGSLADTALLVKQYGELGLTIPLVGGGGHSSKAFRNIAGSASDNMVVVPAFWPGYFKNKEAADFEKGFNTKYTALEGDEWSMFAYDAVMMVAAAMEKVKSTDGEQGHPRAVQAGHHQRGRRHLPHHAERRDRDHRLHRRVGAERQGRGDPRVDAPQDRLTAPQSVFKYSMSCCFCSGVRSVPKLGPV